MTTKATRTQINFFILVFALSIPFWVLGTFVKTTGIFPINLPIAALMLICPITAAIILTRKADKENGVKSLLTRVADYKKIKKPIWYIPTFLLIPILMLLAYILMKWLNIPMPKQSIHLIEAMILFALFFIGAICEEVGWTGYITDPLQICYGAFCASLIIGTVWGVWLIIPYSQANRTPMWILWQFAGTVALGIIIVWLYNNTGKSLLAAILCHTTINMSEYLFPNYGSHDDPFFFVILLVIAVFVITYFWGTKTLCRYRFS
jgi:membrane protease YdiL (CAAX protease family)